MQKIRMTETLANGYSNENAQRELSNEYQHDRVQMVIVLGMKVASALEGLNRNPICISACNIFKLHILFPNCLQKKQNGLKQLFSQVVPGLRGLKHVFLTAYYITLPMLKLLLSKAQGCKDF